jgi:NADH:ubiquinone oxidoreductase subunit F (NADH-binding)
VTLTDSVSERTAPRLLDGILDGDGPASLREHLAVYGDPRVLDGHDVLAAVGASGLQGRGGAGFPAGTKLRAVASRRGRPVVVANGVEGEPVSGKDKVLLRYLPHLVLDGAAAAAAAVGAREAIVAVADNARAERAAVDGAIAERSRAGFDGRVSYRVAAVPDTFVAGEETALVQFLNRRLAKPTFTPPRPYERGVGGAPTAIHNVETLAHLALIARYGAAWFRSIGTTDDPGSALVTLSGAVAEPGVYEVELGTSLERLLAQAGGAAAPVQAFLVGGYFGTWAAPTVAEAPLSHEGLRPFGARLGARAIVALPAGACGVVETARVVRYLAASSARQCGPCVHGLAAISAAFEELASCDGGARRQPLARWIREVRGRGACRHPDGAAAFAASALEIFADEVELHLHGRCSGRGLPVLPVPAEAAVAA